MKIKYRSPRSELYFLQIAKTILRCDVPDTAYHAQDQYKSMQHKIASISLRSIVFLKYLGKSFPPLVTVANATTVCCTR